MFLFLNYYASEERNWVSFDFGGLWSIFYETNTSKSLLFRDDFQILTFCMSLLNAYHPFHTDNAYHP